MAACCVILLHHHFRAGGEVECTECRDGSGESSHSGSHGHGSRSAGGEKRKTWYACLDELWGASEGGIASMFVCCVLGHARRTELSTWPLVNSHTQLSHVVNFCYLAAIERTNAKSNGALVLGKQGV